MLSGGSDRGYDVDMSSVDFLMYSTIVATLDNYRLVGDVDTDRGRATAVAIGGSSDEGYSQDISLRDSGRETLLLTSLIPVTTLSLPRYGKKLYMDRA